MPGKYYQPTSGYTGGLFEEEVLGTCRVRHHGYLQFRAAMDEVKVNQPWDPHQPSLHSAKMMHAAVARKLNVPTTQVELYTAVGSSLDRYHGIDGFFVFQGVVVTIDVTINPQKQGYKADVIVTIDDVESGCDHIAGEIANRLRYGRVKGEVRKCNTSSSV